MDKQLYVYEVEFECGTKRQASARNVLNACILTTAIQIQNGANTDIKSVKRRVTEKEKQYITNEWLTIRAELKIGFRGD